LVCPGVRQVVGAIGPNRHVERDRDALPEIRGEDYELVGAISPNIHIERDRDALPEIPGEDYEFLDPIKA